MTLCHPHLKNKSPKKKESSKKAKLYKEMGGSFEDTKFIFGVVPFCCRRRLPQFCRGLINPQLLLGFGGLVLTLAQPWFSVCISNIFVKGLAAGEGLPRVPVAFCGQISPLKEPICCYNMWRTGEGVSVKAELLCMTVRGGRGHVGAAGNYSRPVLALGRKAGSCTCVLEGAEALSTWRRVLLNQGKC